MYATRVFKLLLLALGVIAVAQAHVLHDARDEAGLRVRQDGGSETGNDASTSTTVAGDGSSSDDANTETTTTRDQETSTTDDASETTTTTQDDPTTTADPGPTTTTTTDTAPEETSSAQNDNTSVAAPTTTSERSTAATTTRDNNDASSTAGDSADDASTTEDVIISTAIETVTRTNSDGSMETLTSSTITTTTPDPQSGDSKDGGSGMTPNTRNIVIGVVVGVGGAFLLGALAVVAWRIRARKRAAEEDAGLMGEYNGGYTQVDKNEPPSTAGGHTPSGTMTSTGQSPFRSTLEGYHAPTQPVNASSNF